MKITIQKTETGEFLVLYNHNNAEIGTYSTLARSDKEGTGYYFKLSRKKAKAKSIEVIARLIKCTSWTGNLHKDGIELIDCVVLDEHVSDTLLNFKGLV